MATSLILLPPVLSLNRTAQTPSTNMALAQALQEKVCLTWMCHDLFSPCRLCRIKPKPAPAPIMNIIAITCYFFGLIYFCLIYIFLKLWHMDHILILKFRILKMTYQEGYRNGLPFGHHSCILFLSTIHPSIYQCVWFLRRSTVSSEPPLHSLLGFRGGLVSRADWEQPLPGLWRCGIRERLILRKSIWWKTPVNYYSEKEF